MGKRIDLTGKVFADLTVIKQVEAPNHVKDKKSKYWECKCICGNFTIVKTSNLNNGHCKRCWECAHYESNKTKRNDLTGKVYGEITVLEMIYPKRSDKEGKTKCKCRCSCGKEIIKNAYDLKKSNRPSCGCVNYEILLDTCSKDINGKRFGKLLVLETLYDFETHTKPKVKCLCDCGKEIILNKNDVQSGHTLSCGCLQKERASESNLKNWEQVISDTGVKIIDRAYKNDKGVWMWNCVCPICNNIFVALPAKIMENVTTSCGCKIKSSYERITENILINYNLKYKSQYMFDDCRYKYKLKFDFAVFDNNDELLFLIENDGQQHYEPIKLFGGDEYLKNAQIRDNIKNEYCKKNNITLLRLPYYLNKEEIENEIKKVI